MLTLPSAWPLTCKSLSQCRLDKKAQMGGSEKMTVCFCTSRYVRVTPSHSQHVLRGADASWFTSLDRMCFPVGEAETQAHIYICGVKRRNGNFVFWVMCAAAAPSRIPLGRGPLLSSNLCLLLIHSPLGTLMWGVWRQPFPQLWART